MNNTCPGPGCNAQYNLTPQHVGRRFPCHQCGHQLMVENSGLVLDGRPVAAPPVQRALPDQHSSGVLDRMRRVTDLATWMFVGGTLLALATLFLPLIDQAKVARLEAKIVAGDVRQKRLDVADQSGAWSKEKSDLEGAVEDAESARRGATYWYRYGTLFGFVLLALGSFAYIDSDQPLVRRILGCTVLVAILLVVLNSLARFGLRLEIGSGM